MVLAQTDSSNSLDYPTLHLETEGFSRWPDWCGLDWAKQGCLTPPKGAVCHFMWSFHPHVRMGGLESRKPISPQVTLFVPPQEGKKDWVIDFSFFSLPVSSSLWEEVFIFPVLLSGLSCLLGNWKQVIYFGLIPVIPCAETKPNRVILCAP